MLTFTSTVTPMVERKQHKSYCLKFLPKVTCHYHSHFIGWIKTFYSNFNQREKKKREREKKEKKGDWSLAQEKKI